MEGPQWIVTTGTLATPRQELVWSAEPNRFLVAEVVDLSPGRALDLACGEGRNAIWLAEQGWTVTGVDFSNVALDKARRLAGSAQRVGAHGSSPISTHTHHPSSSSIS